MGLIAFIAMRKAGRAVYPQKQAIGMLPGVLWSNRFERQKILGEELTPAFLAERAFRRCRFVFGKAASRAFT